VQGVSKELKEKLLSLSEKDKILTVLNKIDIAQNPVKEADICISAKTGEGIETLFKELKETALGISSYSEKSAVVSNLRHYNCLKKANESLGNAKESVNNKLSGEFIAVDLRNAADNLGEIIGEVTSDDILNNIFTKFCIGK
jgi:tRNA modification GTPase